MATDPNDYIPTADELESYLRKELESDEVDISNITDQIVDAVIKNVNMAKSKLKRNA